MEKVKYLGKVIVKGVEFNYEIDSNDYVWIIDPNNNNKINVGQTRPINSIEEANKCAIEQILYSGIFM